MKNLLIGLWGLVHGTVGTMWGLLGLLFILHLDSSPGTKEWAEDSMFIPVGYGMVAIWLIALFISYYELRKNKTGLIIFSAAWFVGIMICIGLFYLRLQYVLGNF